jgi:RimJ/RimL family protein N-acetyltransferase
MKIDVYLRAFEPDDYILINKWRKNTDTFKLTMANKRFISKEREKAWVLERSLNDKIEMYFSICLKENNEMIGYIAIKEMDWINRSAQWGGVTIGELNYRGKGYAFQATLLMLNHVFNELGLNRFYGYWLASHLPSINLALKIGFSEEGTLRKNVFKLGEFHDTKILSILKSEFDNKYGFKHIE